MENSTKVITGKVRFSYANVWEPKSINGGDEKYSVSLIIPKSDKKTIADIKAAIELAKKRGRSQVWRQNSGQSKTAAAGWRCGPGR